MVHYSDVIMSTMASPITSFTIADLAVYSSADQRKHQSSASLAFVRGIHRGPVNSPHKGPVTRKCFHLMTSSCTEWPLVNVVLLITNRKQLILIGAVTCCIWVVGYITIQLRDLRVLLLSKICGNMLSQSHKPNSVEGMINLTKIMSFLAFFYYLTCSVNWTVRNKEMLLQTLMKPSECHVKSVVITAVAVYLLNSLIRDGKKLNLIVTVPSDIWDVPHYLLFSYEI